MTDNTRPITLAAVTGAHGVAGEVRLKLFGDGIDTLSGLESFNEGSLTLKKLRSDNKGGAIARFAEITDRTVAEAMRGTLIEAPRSALPELRDGEFYFADLIGLPVVADTGEPVGTVHAVENFGATDIVEIEKPDRKKFMVPLTKQAIPEWDEKRLIVSVDFID